MNPDPSMLDTALNLLQTGVVANATKDGNDYLVIPANAQVYDLEKLQKSPRNIRQTVDFSRLESFCAYVKEFKDGASKLFMAVSGCIRISARLDYHKPGQASWANHRALFEPVITREWGLWTGSDNRSLDQKTFALLLEDNAVDIIEPAAAEMLDIARNLSAKINVNFKKGLRLEDGTQQLQYEETIEAKAGARGELKVPSAFALSVWEGRPKRSVEARLRYAIKEGALSFSYHLVRPHDVLRAEIDALAEEVGKQTGIPPLFGTAQ